MTMRSISSQLGKGGSLVAQELKALLTELQGFTQSVVVGAAAGTKMNIAAMRVEDTIKSAVVLENALTGNAQTLAPTNDIANITIQATKASGTLTANAIVAGNACVVNGVTYTARATPTLPNEWATGSTDAAQATRIAAAINAYESGWTGSAYRKPRVVATSTGLSGVVTVTALDDGLGNGPVITNSAHAAVVSTVPNAVTVTCASVVENDTLTVNGVVFTAKDSPDGGFLQVDVGADDTIMATNFAAAINAYNTEYGIDAVATSLLAVVTVSCAGPRKGNNVVLTGTATRLAASGSGYLAGGTNTGGIKSTTDLTAKTLFITWFNKDNA